MTQVVETVFRREWSRLVAILARHFGVETLQLVEDVVQDALLRAMQTWPFIGIPANPTAWILESARNRAIDRFRRTSRWRKKTLEVSALIEDGLTRTLSALPPRFEDEIEDSQLRMMFVCCHPGLSVEAQIAMILKVLCGFGDAEIASAFLTTKTVVAQRLSRSRRYLRSQKIQVELPGPEQLPLRIDTVAHALYLLFNEGYKASSGAHYVREDLCFEAIRLAEDLVGRFDAPPIHALLALMYFNAARLRARRDEAGAILLLDRQDRGIWDRAKIELGFKHLARSGRGIELSTFHLEAGIAACHIRARSDEETDWGQVLEFYDLLLSRDPSPIVALNRVVAVAKIHGAAAALRALDDIGHRETVERYVPFYAVTGHLYFQNGERDKAAACFRRGRELSASDTERQLLKQRLFDAGKNAEA